MNDDQHEQAAVKRRRGRPSLSGEKGKRCQITIPPTIAQQYMRYGRDRTGSGRKSPSRASRTLSAGIIKAAAEIKESEDLKISASPAAARANRGVGRPSLSGETGERYQVWIPPTIQAKYRRLGDGSLSAGVIKAAPLIKGSRTLESEEKPAPTTKRPRVRPSDEREQKIEAMMRAASINSARDPRSPEFEAGVRALLNFKCGGVKPRCPFAVGTANADAFFAGIDEGHRIWEREIENAQRRLGA